MPVYQSYNAIYNNQLKEKISEAAAGHGVLEIAKARGYSTKELFRYDLIPTSYLFDEDD